MQRRKLTFLFHRWIGAAVCLQLLAWSLGGAVFSLLDIDEVRGEADARGAAGPALERDTIALGPTEAFAKLGAARKEPAHVGAVLLRDRGLGPYYEFLDAAGAPVVKVHAGTGEVVERIGEAAALSLAERDFTPGARGSRCVLVEGPAQGEYRGKRTPAYRVDLEHPKNPHIYVDAVTGEVLARRNRSWRIFDFFWMLHIMDYGERDDFNHPLLTAFSFLAILSAATGLVLFVWRWVPRRRASG